MTSLLTTPRPAGYPGGVDMASSRKGNTPRDSTSASEIRSVHVHAQGSHDVPPPPYSPIPLVLPPLVCNRAGEVTYKLEYWLFGFGGSVRYMLKWSPPPGFWEAQELLVPLTEHIDWPELAVTDPRCRASVNAINAVMQDCNTTPLGQPVAMNCGDVERAQESLSGLHEIRRIGEAVVDAALAEGFARRHQAHNWRFERHIRVHYSWGREVTDENLVDYFTRELCFPEGFVWCKRPKPTCGLIAIT